MIRPPSPKPREEIDLAEKALFGVRAGPQGAGGFCHTFSETGQQGKQNVGIGILIFSPRPEKTGPEGAAGQGATKILVFQHFS